MWFSKSNGEHGLLEVNLYAGQRDAVTQWEIPTPAFAFCISTIVERTKEDLIEETKKILAKKVSGFDDEEHNNQERRSRNQ